MKIQNPYRLGLLAGLGVLTALVIGGALVSLGTVLTYVGTAIFLALGIDPLVTFLERKGVPRPLAILVIFLVLLGSLAGILLAVIPVVVNQASALVTQIVQYAQSVSGDQFIENLQSFVPREVFDVQSGADQLIEYLSNASNVATITGNVLTVAFTIGNALFGMVVIVILTMYFTASLNSFKSGLYKLIPATRRARFADIAEQITQSVGRYVTGQVGLALVNGVLSFIYLSIVGAALPAVWAFIAFLFSLLPLVGTITGSALIVLGQIVLLPESMNTWIAVAVYYLVYMQIEAYVLSPNIMNRAVKVPGVVVVIAALTGGTLLGVLGALIAVPVAAAVLLIIRQVAIPLQNER
ncbi:AI-2E family transporter [Clavibacter sp. Sh2141]|uniref:AI-2E family transporter n=1 Tax=unclassified Clavibacter TaxID=2626594 RepID=UPI0039BCBE11